MVTGKDLNKVDVIPLDDASQYISIMGSLQYFNLTRSNIAFNVNKPYKFLSSFTDIH